jgi:hypothetical protein
LDPRVATDNAILKGQFKVVYLAILPDEKRVEWHLVRLGRLAGDGTVLNLPKPSHAFPSIQGGAIKDGFGRGVFSQNQRGQ